MEAPCSWAFGSEDWGDAETCEAESEPTEDGLELSREVSPCGKMLSGEEKPMTAAGTASINKKRMIKKHTFAFMRAPPIGFT